MRKNLLTVVILLIICSCSKDNTESDSTTNEYEIYTRVSFRENIYTMYVDYIHDGDKSFVRYEQNDETSSYFEDSKTFLVDEEIGIEIESKTTVPTKTIDIQVRNVGSGKLLVSKTIEKSVVYNMPGQHRVKLIYNVKSGDVDIQFLN